MPILELLRALEFLLKIFVDIFFKRNRKLFLFISLFTRLKTFNIIWSAVRSFLMRKKKTITMARYHLYHYIFLLYENLLFLYKNGLFAWLYFLNYNNPFFPRMKQNYISLLMKNKRRVSSIKKNDN